MSMPEMHHVSSSNIASVGYDADSQTVYVQFLNGSVYAYKGVNENEFENLRTAASVGSYLNRNYKNIYPYEKVA
jgi:KTSC domain